MEGGVAAAAAERAQAVDYGLRIVAQEQVGLAYAGWDRLLTRVALPAWRMGRWPSRLGAGGVSALTELSPREPPPRGVGRPPRAGAPAPPGRAPGGGAPPAGAPPRGPARRGVRLPAQRAARLRSAGGARPDRRGHVAAGRAALPRRPSGAGPGRVPGRP